MYLILCTLFFKLYSQNTTIEYNFDSPRHYNLHTNEDKMIISLSDAIDAKLIKKSDQSSCHLNNKNIQLLYKNIQIIDNNEFTADDYEEDTPFNFREFICMTQVKDGIIALTTDLFLYLFLFDYNAIYSTSNNNFAQITWKADLQSLLGEEEKFEFAQITYLEQTEQALVLFKGLAYLFSVKQMKLTNQSIEIESVGDWITRDERGLTKYIEKFIFSCVGNQGIDIYQEGIGTIKFIQNLNFDKLGIDNFNLKDFAIIKLDTNDFRLFCLDVKGDIFIIDIFIEDQELSFEKRCSIQSKGIGVAIDTKNGQNIFVIYQNKHVYIVNELWVPLDGFPNYLVLDSFETTHQIKDVDATEEFAILQGLSHHKILFSDRQYQKNSNFTNLPTFIQYGMRDFEFFKLVPNTNQIYIDYDDEYEPDNFFFGITANKIILSQFKVQPIQIKCFADKHFDNQYYQLIYNTSKITEIRSNLNEQITQNSFNFTVEFTTTYIFENELIKLQLIFIGLFLLILSLFMYWVYRKKQTIKELEQQIHKHQKKQSEIIQQVQFQTPYVEVGNLVQKN